MPVSMPGFRNPLGRKEDLTGIPRSIVRFVDRVKSVILEPLPPPGVGIGIGVGFGYGVGWSLARVRTRGLGPPEAFGGAGVGVGVGFGIGQGFGVRFGKSQQSAQVRHQIKRLERAMEAGLQRIWRMFTRGLNRGPVEL